jgi:hypothetical protein
MALRFAIKEDVFHIAVADYSVMVALGRLLLESGQCIESGKSQTA